jgi:hypothetical protein
MNTIPTIGPDTAVAPRTGSGSPQTPSQQRADNAPAVIADSGAASADPGVLLKVTPPVMTRQGDGAIMSEASGLPSTEAMAKALANLATPTVDTAGEQADVAIAKRINDAFALLPVDVQEAIKQASSPAIAHLLRLAAITYPGIRDAPAHFLSTSAALAELPQQAANVLYEALRAAPPFQLARMLKESLAMQEGPQALEARSLLNQLRAFIAAGKQSPQASNHLTASGKVGDHAKAVFGHSNFVDDLLGLSGSEPSSTFERLTTVTQAQQNERNLQPEARPTSAPGRSTDEKGQLMSKTGEFSDQKPQQSTALIVQTPQQGEQALRDGLKILMDGRIVWHGLFTPDVPMSMERSDAWRADREATGGMEKGTSVQVQFNLPHLGAVELRAVSFNGQVAARVQVGVPMTSVVAQALPDLHKRLRDRGLDGAQVAVESN